MQSWAAGRSRPTCRLDGTRMKLPKQSLSDTKIRILDTAERLFAVNGFRGTTIKRLASMAGVNLAAVNYHFGTKADLIEKVVERRLGAINQERMLRLESVRSNAARENRKPAVSDVVRAFIEPVYLAPKPLHEKRCFMAMASRAFSEPDATIRTVLISQSTEPFNLFFKVMRKALPDLPESLLLWRLHLSVGAMTHCMRICSGMLPPLGTFPKVEDLKKPTELLLEFVISGICDPIPRNEGQ